MRIDQTYLKQLLNSFLDSENHYTDLSNIKESGIDIDDKFVFHMQILEDQNFVEGYGENRTLTYSVTINGRFVWTGNIMRLTASGHEFAESLNKKEVFEVLAEEFKGVSIGTLSAVAKELMIALAKKQASKYFEI